MTHKWLTLTEDQAWEQLTEIWLSGRKYADVDLVRVLQGHTLEDLREVIYYAGRGEENKAKNVLETFCDEFLGKNPKLVQWFIKEKSDEIEPDTSYLDDPRRGQAESINRKVYA